MQAILTTLAAFALVVSLVALLLRAEGLPPDEADALWREAWEDAVSILELPGMEE